MPVGYSGTPLPKKLGITESTRLLVTNAPDDYLVLLGELPEGLICDKRLSKSTTLIHLFTKSRSELEERLGYWRVKIATDTVVWISWPKKASKVPTDITEDVIREVALPLGFVDVKVCALSDVWSGLKLVIRKELR
ncbi:MAG: DUF3052 domain-containing protein [Planctomycetes bacterium]|nr:DUF3052 domain-containing protein [Planctomycetota bacterium]